VLAQQAKTDRKRGLLGRALKVGVSAAAVALLLRQVDERAMAAALVAARPTPVIGAIVVYLLGQSITAWRWQIIARAVGFREGLGRMLSWYYIGMFFNLFGPSTLGGDVVRSLYLGAPTSRRALALNTVVFDRLSGLTLLVVLALLAFTAFGTFGLPRPVVLTTVVLAGALMAGWWVLPPFVRRVLPVDNRLRKLVDSDLQPLWRDGALLAQTSAISIAFHVVQIGAAWLIGWAVGLEVPWPYYFVFHPLVSIFSALPVSLAGLGIREVGYVWFLSSVGHASQEHAAAFALLWLLVLLVSSLAGGLVFLAEGASVPALRGTRTVSAPEA
jgi:uncharacterized membrane protein YbhN (UPF0104 family)